MKLSQIGLLALGTALAAPAAFAAAPPETHVFHIKVNVTYRCYGGYDPKIKIYDTRTHVLCDNKDYPSTLFDKDVPIRIVNEPTPDNSPDLVGSTIQEFSFKGRKFTVGLTLFKAFPAGGQPAYTLSMVAEDDETTTRHSTYIAHADSRGKFTPIEVEYRSAGQPEEIQMRTNVEEIRR
jgi:hypothetical protein